MAFWCDLYNWCYLPVASQRHFRRHFLLDSEFTDLTCCDYTITRRDYESQILLWHHGIIIDGNTSPNKKLRDSEQNKSRQKTIIASYLSSYLAAIIECLNFHVCIEIGMIFQLMTFHICVIKTSNKIIYKSFEKLLRRWLT